MPRHRRPGRQELGGTLTERELEKFYEQGARRPGTLDPDTTQEIVSPGDWTVPQGRLPAWDWSPPGHGLRPRLQGAPLWIRWGYRIPVVRRRIFVTMWWRGHWWAVRDGIRDDVT